MITRSILRYALPLAVVLSLVGCTIRDLYYEQYTPVRVQVNIDWKNFGMKPAGTTILFYPEEGGAPYEFKTNNVESEEVMVPAGYYNILVFNLSTSEFGSFNFLGMDSYETARIELDQKRFAWLEHADSIGRTVYEPEKIMTGVAEHFLVNGAERRYVKERPASADLVGKSTPPMTKEEDASVTVWKEIVDSVTIAVQRIVFTGDIYIHAQGIDNIASIRSYMTGLSSSVYLASRLGGSEVSTFVPQTWDIIPDEGDYTQGTLQGTFLCLGLPEQYRGFQVPENNDLKMELLLRDQKTVVDTTFAVGDLIVEHEMEFSLNLNLEVETPVPEVKPVDSNESGFEFDFKDWEDVEDVYL